MSTNQTAESGAKAFDLSRVHEVNLKMLKEIDRICRKHGIQYALDSGTLLGAIRHQGFIPWDDDVDVMFTRKNYEKFARVARRELPPGMSFVEPNEYHDGTAFYDFVPRLIYENSRKFEESGKMAFYDEKISRLCVDLFIADALPDGKLTKPLTRLCHCVVYGLALGHRWKVDLSDYKGIMKAFVFVLSGIGKRIPFPAIYRMWKGLCRKDLGKPTHLYFYSSYAPDYFYVEIEKDVTDRVLEVPFEDTKLYIPEGWDAYLKQVYGDYRKLPPEEKRIPEHSDMEIKIYG